jgi:hypothetical protein
MGYALQTEGAQVHDKISRVHATMRRGHRQQIVQLIQTSTDSVRHIGGVLYLSNSEENEQL